MLEFLRMWLALRSDARGVTAIEYALIAALIALAIVGTLTAFAGDLEGVFTNIGTALNNAG